MENKKKYISFRRKLILYSTLLVLLVAIPAIFLAVQLPWKELQHMVDRSKSLIDAVRNTLSHEQLAQMNQFALERYLETKDMSEEEIDHLDEAFNLYMREDNLPPQDLVEKELKESGSGKMKTFSYTQLQQMHAFWVDRFADKQDLLLLFRKTKLYLQELNKEEAKIGFPISDIYIVLDTGEKTGQFVTVIDGSSWWESFMTGGEYVAPDSSGWRELSSTQQQGYSHNLVSNPKNFYLPQFYTDEWGEWFSVWYTVPIGSAHDIISLDFDARDVKKAMWLTGLSLLTIGLLTLFVIIVVTNRLSRRYSRSPMALTKGITEVSRGNYQYTVPPLYDEFGEVGRQFNRMTLKLQERDRLMQTLEKLLSKELAQDAAKKGLVLGGERIDCTLMFTDFAGFSSITQHMPPEEVVLILNEYFEVLIKILVKNGGFPDKFIGDAIVAIFGAPVRFSNHAERAVRCAIEMQQAIRKLNEQRMKEGKIVFEMRIGLNTGKVLVGAIGSNLKMEYTSIGETTNLAQRMESNSRIGHIMITDQTYKQLKKNYLADLKTVAVPGKTVVKGYAKPVKTYDILVSDIEISKNANSRNIREFYSYKKGSHV